MAPGMLDLLKVRGIKRRDRTRIEGRKMVNGGHLRRSVAIVSVRQRGTLGMRPHW
jgi:hypothetical protein